MLCPLREPRAPLARVNLPKNITAPVDESAIIENWDERLARVTTPAIDFEKVCYGVTKDKLAGFHMKVFLKKPEWKKKLGAARKAAAGSGSAAGSGLADAAAFSADATPALNKKRGLKRNLSEISVPEELLA